VVTHSNTSVPRNWSRAGGLASGSISRTPASAYRFSFVAWSWGAVERDDYTSRGESAHDRDRFFLVLIRCCLKQEVCLAENEAPW
jgi:hypothetical protein